jgi:hypothetical protein
MGALATLARMLGVGAHQAEDALQSERAARAALSRRDLFAAAGALAAGSAFSFAAPQGVDVVTIALGIDQGRVPGSYMQIIYARGQIGKGQMVCIDEVETLKSGVTVVKPAGFMVFWVGVG